MNIYLDKKTLRKLRSSIMDAMEQDDYETLKETFVEAFSEEQVDEIESVVESADIYDFISDVIDEWSGEDEDELFELIAAELQDVDIIFHFRESDIEDGIGEEVDDDDDEEEDEVDVDDEVDEVDVDTEDNDTVDELDGGDLEDDELDFGDDEL